jgi:hypothetical protein
MLDSSRPIDAIETNEEHKNSLGGAELIDGNQLVEGEADGEDAGLIDGNQLVEGEVDGKDVGLIGGNQLVEGEVDGNNEMEGDDEYVGLGVG